MLDQLRDGDVVVVTKYDRLARSLRDLLDIVEAIKERGAGFRSLAKENSQNILEKLPSRANLDRLSMQIADLEELAVKACFVSRP